MDDNNHLRMIANPFLLKKNTKEPSSEQIIKIKNNHFLYLYIEKKYPSKYISPSTFYEIIKIIDDKIIENDIKEIVKDIIQSVIIKFDTNYSDDTISIDNSA